MNMTLESLIILLIVAGIVGAIGQRLAGYSRSGLLTSIVIGFKCGEGRLCAAETDRAPARRARRRFDDA
jgi:hypothetical protein